jgi:adenylate kinase family enzyme
MIGELVARDAWVMDGNYGRTLDVRLDAADTIIFLDLPRVVCTWRIFKRTWQHRGRVRPDVAPGCPEHLTWGFVWWVWTYRSRRRPAILERLATHSREKTVIIMRSAGEVERFIARLAPPMSR